MLGPSAETRPRLLSFLYCLFFLFSSLSRLYPPSSGSQLRSSHMCTIAITSVLTSVILTHLSCVHILCLHRLAEDRALTSFS